MGISLPGQGKPAMPIEQDREANLEKWTFKYAKNMGKLCLVWQLALFPSMQFIMSVIKLD